MERAFWLRQGCLAGRPGPDIAPWKPARLREAGIGAVLSVNHACACDARALVAADIEHACFPLSSSAPPRRGDVAHCLDALPRAYDFTARALDRGRPVLVHCTFGKDRTALFMAYFLMRTEGLDRRAAMASVRLVRPGAFSAIGWDKLAREVLGRASRETAFKNIRSWRSGEGLVARCWS